MTKLPASKIVVSKGMVQSIEVWTLWNGDPARTTLITRTSKGFTSSIGDPEHGGRSREGVELGDVMGGLHRNVRAKYELLFGMHDATEGQLRRYFPNYEIKMT